VGYVCDRHPCTGSALNYLQAITQVSGQPDRGRVPNCCRSTCLDYVTMQSPAYAARQENASIDSRPNYRVWPPPSSSPARPVWHRRGKMHKSLQVHPCLNSTTLCCAKLISLSEDMLSDSCTFKLTDLTVVVTMWHMCLTSEKNALVAGAREGQVTGVSWPPLKFGAEVRNCIMSYLNKFIHHFHAGPLYCINNQHNFKRWGQNPPITLHDKTWFSTLTPCWKMVSARLVGSWKLKKTKIRQDVKN